MSRAARIALALAAVGALGACGDDRDPGLAWGVGVAVRSASAYGLAGSGSGSGGEDDPDAPAWLTSIEDTARVFTPTYDGAAQCTHPDVLIDDGRAILAVTPYAYSDDRLENPSLLVTGDGVTFSPLPGAADPLVPAPPVDHNDDPDLRRLADGGYELLYLDTERPATQTLVALDSPDLVTWTRRDAIRYDLPAGDPFIVSPAAVVDDAGATHLFYVSLGSDTNRIATQVAPDADGPWSARADATVQLALGDVIPWHLDVLRAGRGYAMLISGYVGADQFTHQDLYLATSPDLTSWTLAPAPVLDHAELAVPTLYRSTAVVAGDRLIIWYAMQYDDRAP